MKKLPVFQLLLAALIYCALFILASSCGLIHPACYACAGTFVPILFSFVYLYAAANIQGFGAALLLNGFVLIVGLIAGEGNPRCTTHLTTCEIGTISNSSKHFSIIRIRFIR